MADNFQSEVEARGNSRNENNRSSTKSSKEEYGFNYDKIIKEHKDSVTKMLGVEKEFYETIEKLAEDTNLSELKKRMSNEKLSKEERLKAEEEFLDTRKKLEEQAYAITSKKRDSIDDANNKNRSMRERARLAKETSTNLKQYKSRVTQQFLIEYEAAQGNEEEKKKLREKYAKDVEEIDKGIEENQKLADKYNKGKGIKRAFGGISQEDYQSRSKAKLDGIDANLAAKNAELAQIAATYSDLTEVEKKKAKEREEELEKEVEILKDQRDVVEEIGEAQAKAIEKFRSDVDSSYEKAFSLLTENVGKINSRLQGSGLGWDSMTGLISKNLAVNPFVKTEQVINNMIKATEQGIAYNVEQRAFLATISEKIASTFNAFDSSLLRLVRLQQADSTIARLGIEASLTKFLNSMYEDTSYLSNLSSSVANAILDANAQLGRNASAEFEYTVQKWLGSLSSLGMGDSTINNIAQGLNYLATGDVTSLSNNTSLNTLFAMSANKAGLNYAQLLTNGLNAADTNKLLESMVSYLKDIAENSDNQVVKNAYGNIFGMSLSDFRSITNLNSNDISTIAGNKLSYDNLVNEVNNQLSFANLWSRTNTSEMLNNAYHNALFGVANTFTSNPGLYATRQMLMFLSGQETDINIPFISAAGFGLDLNTSVMGLARMALGIGEGLALAGNILGGLSARGGLDLDSWNAKETTSRGGIGNLLSTIIGGTSSSTFISNTNKDDITNQSLAQATDDAEETKKITNKNSQEGADKAEDAYEALALASSKHGNGNEFFWVKDALLNLVFDINHMALRTYDKPLHDTFINVLGTQSVVDSGYIKTKLSIPLQNNALPVHIVSSGTDIAVKIVEESLNTLKNNSATQTVKISSDSAAISIDNEAIRVGVMDALLAIINNEENENTLSKFLENATNDAVGIPIKNSTFSNIGVVVNNNAGSRIPVKIN